MYREEEKLCLKWNDFQENAVTAFGTLREDRELCDVTLACEDGQQIEAHKVILASSSPFFLNILRRNKHSHPLIYMRGLKSEDLVAMIDFLYYGEANVYQESLDSFLAVAEELQLKGLMGSGGNKESDTTIKEPAPNKKTPKQMQSRNPRVAMASDIKSYVGKVESDPPLDGTVAVSDFTRAADLQDLDEKIKSLMESTDRTISVGNQKRALMVCKVCGKEGQLGNIQKHIESIHITGVSHTCDICGKVLRSKNAFFQHKYLHNKL